MVTFVTLEWYEVLHYKENPAIYWMTLVYWLLKQYIFKAAVYFESGIFYQKLGHLCE